MRVFLPIAALSILCPVFLSLGSVRMLAGAVESRSVKTGNQCAQVFLPQNVNGLNGPFTFKLWALQGCEVQGEVSITLTYSFALFVIDPETGIAPGPHFELGKASVSKGLGDIDLSFQLNRVGNAGPGELLATLTVQAAVGFPVIGSGVLEWSEFRADSGTDISEQVPAVLITRASVPSRPVLGLPDPITSTTLQASWFLNPDSEGVLTYTASVMGPTGEAAAETIPATQTAVLLAGLRPGTPYTLQLAAANVSGEGAIATLEFTTRYDWTGSQRDTLLEGLSHEWDPYGLLDGSLQSAVPSPVDLNLDGGVNAEDALEILQDHHDRQTE